MVSIVMKNPISDKAYHGLTAKYILKLENTWIKNYLLSS
jgi:hypothetical protein